MNMRKVFEKSIKQRWQSAIIPSEKVPELLWIRKYCCKPGEKVAINDNGFFECKPLSLMDKFLRKIK